MVSQDSTAAVGGKQFQSPWHFIPACSPVSCSPSCRSNHALHSCVLVGGKQRVGIEKISCGSVECSGVSLPWLIQPKGVPTNALAVLYVYSDTKKWCFFPHFCHYSQVVQVKILFCRWMLECQQAKDTLFPSLVLLWRRNVRPGTLPVCGPKYTWEIVSL